MSTKFAVQVLACAALGAVSLTVAVHAQQAAMTFFVTSVGKGDGGNLAPASRVPTRIAWRWPRRAELPRPVGRLT